MRLAAATKAKADFENALPHALLTQSGPPRTVRILARGNWMDTTGPVMTPNTPGFLPPLPKKSGRYTRLDLAKWTVSRDNPLTARVAVNRLWKLFYGHGIARSLEESGSQGQLPTHPELLDWLASEFQSKWDVKHIVRLMVTSETYRQSSVESPAVRERDPAEQALCAAIALSARCRVHPRHSALGERPLERRHRRSEREALSAAGLLGGAELPRPRMAEGFGREGLSSRHVHPLAAERSRTRR